MKNSIAEIKKTAKPLGLEGPSDKYCTYQYDITDEVKKIIGDLVIKATMSFSCYENQLLEHRDRLLCILSHSEDYINIDATEVNIWFNNDRAIQISISEFATLSQLKQEDK